MNLLYDCIMSPMTKLLLRRNLRPNGQLPVDRVESNSATYLISESGMRPTTIAIDGPAASGKSTLGAALAEHLGYLYFDTGVMYRAVTWAALECGLDIAAEASIARLAESIQIDVEPASQADGRQYDVICDGVDVT